MFSSLRTQIFRNGRIIAGGMLEGNGRQPAARLKAYLSVLAPLLHHGSIILRAYQDNYILEILSCRANECNTANVDLRGSEDPNAQISESFGWIGRAQDGGRKSADGSPAAE